MPPIDDEGWLHIVKASVALPHEIGWRPRRGPSRRGELDEEKIVGVDPAERLRRARGHVGRRDGSQLRIVLHSKIGWSGFARACSASTVPMARRSSSAPL